MRFIALCLVLLSAGPVLAWDPVPPVRPEAPIPPQTARAFNNEFRRDINNALATPSLTDDGLLAARLFDVAIQRRSQSDLAACCLDHVVQLGSVAPGRQKLVYDALREQKVCCWRPALPCLEKMMLVGPRVAEELVGKSREEWLNKTWAADAVELVEMQSAALEFEQADRALLAVADAAKAHGLAVPPAIVQNLEGVAFLKNLSAACRKYEAEVQEPGEHPQANIVLAIMRLVRDKRPDEARKHLKASGVATALELDAAMGAYAKASDSVAASLRLARATAALADKTQDGYFQLLLWKEAEGRLEGCLKSEGLASSEQQEAETLKDELGRRSAALAALPRTVQRQIAALRISAAGQTADSPTFFGISLKQSLRVAYVVDHSGSMTDSLEYVKVELKRAIGTLTDGHSFSVFFYSSGPAVALPGGMLKATADNKQRAYQFIAGIVPVGQTDPSDALNQAFALKPDVIYLLTDGEFEEKIPALIDRLTANKKVVINTLCFIYTGGEAVLQAIAKRNNGTYRYIGENDLEGLK